MDPRRGQIHVVVVFFLQKGAVFPMAFQLGNAFWTKVIPAELPETAPSFLAALAMGIDFFTTGPGRMSLA